jgi:hypothetical protein
MHIHAALVLRDTPAAQGTIFFSILFGAMKGRSFTGHGAEAMATTVNPVRKALTTKDTKDTKELARTACSSRAGTEAPHSTVALSVNDLALM